MTLSMSSAPATRVMSLEDHAHCDKVVFELMFTFPVRALGLWVVQ